MACSCLKEAQKEAHHIRLAVEYNLETLDSSFNFLEKGQVQERYFVPTLILELSFSFYPVKMDQEGMKVQAERLLLLVCL